jgi:serine/threonine protein phosphatase PrpC
MTHWDLRIGAGSDMGRHRQRNEDSFCVLLPGDGLSPQIAAMVAVADGMGGHDAGDVASAFVIGAVRAAFGDGVLGTSAPDLEAQLAAMLRRANIDLHAAAVEQGSARGMGSTITLAAVRGDALVVAHVGDSRLYRMRDGRMEQITEDHSWTAEQRRRGLLSLEEEAAHPRRNLLTDCIGVDREISVFTTTLELEERDRFLLCSDGLHGPVSDEEIAAILEHPDPEEAARLLIERANDAGGPDNITAVVLDVKRGSATSLDGHKRAVAADDSSLHAAGDPLQRFASELDDPAEAGGATDTDSRRFIPRWTLASVAIVVVLLVAWAITREPSGSGDREPAESRELPRSTPSGAAREPIREAPMPPDLLEAQESERLMDSVSARRAAIDSADTVAAPGRRP